MAKTNVPKKVLDLLAEVGLSTHQAGCMGAGSPVGCLGTCLLGNGA